MYNSTSQNQLIGLGMSLTCIL